MKKFHYGKRIISVVLCCSLLLVGCNSGSDEGGSESERFQEYTDELFREDIVENTINLHYTLAYPEDYGITDYEITDANNMGAAMAPDDVKIRPYPTNEGMVFFYTQIQYLRGF